MCVGYTHIFTNVGIRHKELGCEVFLRDLLVINDGERSDSCQHQVLRDLVRQSLDTDEEYIGFPYTFEKSV
jgi:hypothetical protein